jgi:hypothetical protein
MHARHSRPGHRRLGTRLDGLLLAGLGALGALGALATPAQAWQVEVLDVVDLPPAWRAQELSGLAWVAARQQVLAVSDRGLLWRLPVTWTGAPGAERLQLGAAPESQRLDDGGTGARLNAEAIEWRQAPGDGPGGALLVADEAGHRVLAFDLAGRLQGTLPLPGPTGQRERLRGRNAGIEAMTWHPVHGLVVGTQRPLHGTDSAVHRLQADDGRPWSLRAAGTRSAIKAAAWLDPSTLLVLERTGSGRGLQAWLRPMAAPACDSEAGCDAPALSVSHPALDGSDNLEGLACVGDGLCLLVSDNAGRGATRLLLVRLRR